MKRIVLIATTAAMLALSTPAQAHPTYHYGGGCRIAAVSDGTDSPHTMWTGVSTGVVWATTATFPAYPVPVPTSFYCYMYIDGVFVRDINSGSGSGTGFAADADILEYAADPDAIVTICLVADIGSDPSHTDCGNATTQPVSDTLQDNVVGQIDPTVCPLLGAMAPGIPGIVDIAPEGDVYVGGVRVSKDCPPYTPGPGGEETSNYYLATYP